MSTPKPVGVISTTVLILVRTVAWTGLAVALLCWAVGPQSSEYTAYRSSDLVVDAMLNPQCLAIGWGTSAYDASTALQFLDVMGDPVGLSGVRLWWMSDGVCKVCVDYFVFAALFLAAGIALDRRTLSWLTRHNDGDIWKLLHRMALWSCRGALAGAVVLCAVSQWTMAGRTVTSVDQQARVFVDSRGVVTWWAPSGPQAGIFNTTGSGAIEYDLHAMAKMRWTGVPTWSSTGVTAWLPVSWMGGIEVAHWLICSVLLVLVLVLDWKLVTRIMRFVTQKVFRQKQVADH